MKNMFSDLSLDHLKEEELKIILAVLERDAKIQSFEDDRIRKLKEPIRGERIPGDHLSIKLRTGDWLNEISTPSKVKESRVTDVIKASIIKKKRVESKIEPKRDDYPKDTETNSELHLKPNVVVEADEISLSKSPLRKTSIRRKNLLKDKQVKFDDQKTENISYSAESSQLDCNKKKISEEEAAKFRQLTENVNKTSQVEISVSASNISSRCIIPEEESYGSGVFSSKATFESYHNALGLNNQLIGNKDDVPRKDDKPDKEKPKKIRVVRKGSSRRKVTGKLTDDSDRDSLFKAPDPRNEDKSNSLMMPLLIESESLYDTILQSTKEIYESKTDFNSDEFPVEKQPEEEIFRTEVSRELFSALPSTAIEPSETKMKKFENAVADTLQVSSNPMGDLRDDSKVSHEESCIVELRTEPTVSFLLDTNLVSSDNVRTNDETSEKASDKKKITAAQSQTNVGKNTEADSQTESNLPVTKFGLIDVNVDITNISKVDEEDEENITICTPIDKEPLEISRVIKREIEKETEKKYFIENQDTHESSSLQNDEVDLRVKPEIATSLDDRKITNFDEKRRKKFIKKIVKRAEEEDFSSGENKVADCHPEINTIDDSQQDMQGETMKNKDSKASDELPGNLHKIVVKRIVKKKTTEQTEESAVLEQKRDCSNEEEDNTKKLSRRKTVRKKVVKKQTHQEHS